MEQPAQSCDRPSLGPEQTTHFPGWSSDVSDALRPCADCDGPFLHLSPLASAKSLENTEHLWKILNALRLPCLFFILCLCCFFWFNKQGESKEVNSARFKVFLTNGQHLTRLCLRLASLGLH